MGRLEQRAAIVTGGASGIGKAIAREYVRQGAKVCVADLGQGRCDAAAAEIGGDCFGQALDVTHGESIAQCVAATVRKFGALDILVNSAGVFGMGTIATVAAEEFDRVVAVNTKGLLFMIQAAVNQMLVQGKGGSIVTVASGAGRRPAPGAVVYSLSKAAAISITQCAAQELAQHGIRVNAIAPGAVRTPMWMEVEEKFSATLHVPVGSAEQAQVGLTPLGRMAKPEEFAGAAVFLASDEASYMTGQTLNVDGGMNLG
jgi:D-sorbitol dehydrogenase (acceptor)